MRNTGTISSILYIIYIYTYINEEETEVKKNKEWAFIELGKLFPSHAEMYNHPDDITVMKCELLNKVYDILSQLDEPEQPKITLQDVTDKLWELPLNNRELWLSRLNDEFQEGYIVPLGLKTTDGEEQYLTYNGSYFASRRNKYLQQTFDKLEEIPEFYRGLAERVL